MVQGQDIDVGAVEGAAGADPNAALGGGVPAGAELVAFTEASVGGDPHTLDASRTALEAVVGPAATVDAAAVAAAFQMMNRVANATGTPLDGGLVDFTAGVRGQLSLDYLSAAP